MKDISAMKVIEFTCTHR